MQLIQLIYVSQPFGFDDLTRFDILNVARKNNKRDAITGSLISRADIYLQMLEGEEGPVNAAFARILRDSRHGEVTGLCVCKTGARLFPAWDMRDDPVRSWMWTEGEVRDGAAQKASGTEALAIFTRLAAEPAPDCRLN